MPNRSLARYFRLKEGQESLPEGTREMGLAFMLASLGMLFAAVLVGYFTVRWMAPEWPPPGTPELPRSLWAGTVLLVLGSVSVQLAVNAVRSARLRALAARLRWTLLLGVLFLAVQVWNWIALVRVHGGPADGMFGFLFFALTLLHAVHVLGGLIPLAVATVRAGRGRYAPDSSYGIRSLAIYWHFLGGTWLVLFAVLYILDRP